MTSNPSGFFSSHCPSCQRRVLGERALAQDASLVWQCLHCATHLDARSEEVRWLEAHELDLVACYIEGEEAEPKHGEHGGCRGGTCGVQQPS